MATKKPAKPRAPVDYTSKLYIGNELAALDRKDRGYLDSMTDEEQRKFSPFLMIRWGATVEGVPELQQWYLESTNTRLNRHFFDISSTEHKKLHWLLATTISPDMGKQTHKWLAAGKSGNDNKAIKFLKNIYPTAKKDELELLARINTRDDLKQLAREYGWDDRRIKDEL
jgi:hypothetical protein